MEISEQARATKELLYERGWTQGRYVGDDGRLCLLGAISRIPASFEQKAALTRLLCQCAHVNRLPPLERPALPHLR